VIYPNQKGTQIDIKKKILVALRVNLFILLPELGDVKGNLLLDRFPRTV